MSDSKNISNTHNIINNIEKEREELKEKQQEIDTVVTQLKDQILSDLGDNNNGYTNYRQQKVKKSAAEKIELIRAFVELQKLSVDINKTVISTFEKEHKMNLDYLKYLDSKNDEKQAVSLTPSEIAKLAKKINSNKDQNKS